MKAYCLILILPLFAAGCSMVEPLTDAAAGAGGGYIADRLSNGNPAITAAGAAGGVLLSEGGFYLANREATNAYAAGYNQGRSDAVKQQYWILVEQQQQQGKPTENISLYAIPVPEQTVDGVILEPTTKYLRIEN